jgi:hypothetical protein
MSHTSFVSRRRTRARQSHCAVACLAALAMTPTVPTALATEPLSGYGPTTPTPTTTAPPKPSAGNEPARAATNKRTPITGTAPSKETTRPEEVARPEEAVRPEEANKPVAAVAMKPHRKLPFTGFDVRLELILGALLIAAGYPLLRLQRRRGSCRAPRRPLL